MVATDTPWLTESNCLLSGLLEEFVNSSLYVSHLSPRCDLCLAEEPKREKVYWAHREDADHHARKAWDRSRQMAS